ncbi:hypothetical protein [uncultured Methanobrevibacter sp.]|uniref:hypothetical protein n=1 Tax=uncultured Methanobrevibacter sp. TaxID=253161 RepID=UPI0025E50BBC|nr:hypothetical protein [uncultured Methanobrevibacter sp.]
MKIDKYYLCGTILIIIACSLYFTSFLDMLVRPFFQIILMGSSKGKDVLFFGIFGLFLILSRFCERHKLNILNKSNDFYLKLTFTLLIIIGLIAIITEIYIRLKLNFPINSTFVVIDPSMTSTSIMHSHVFKSVFGFIVSVIIPNIPAGIHLGNSLEPYIPNFVKFSFILMVLLFITMVKACENRSMFIRFLTIFFFSCGIIGIMDGGIFSTPGVGGVYGCLVILFNGFLLDKHSRFNSDYYNDNIKDDKPEGITSIISRHSKNLSNVFKTSKTDFNTKQLIKILLPHLILILIIVIRFSLIFAMAQTGYYEVNIINPHDSINLDDYGVLTVVEENNRTVYHLSSNHNEMILLNSLANNLESKCDGFSITWNAYSYL